MCGCHARWSPLGSKSVCRGPGRYTEGKLTQPMRGLLSEDDAGYAVGFKYDILSPGKLSISAAPDVASVSLDLSVFADGAMPVATTKGRSEKRLDVQVVLGTYFVIVSEPWKDAVKTGFTLTAVFTPGAPDVASGSDQPISTPK